MQSAKQEKETTERSLAGMMDKVSRLMGDASRLTYRCPPQDTSRGLQAVMRIARERGIQGVYGPLYSLFEVNDRWNIAVEVTAGNRWG